MIVRAVELFHTPGRMRLMPAPCWSVPVVTTSLKALELTILLVLISLTTSVGRMLWVHDWVWPRSVLLVIALCSVVAFETLRMSGAYRLRRLTSGHGQWRRTGFAAVTAGLTGMGVLLLLDAPYAIVAGLGGMLLISISITLSVARAGATWVLAGWLRDGRFATKVAVVGQGPVADALADRLVENETGLLQIVGRYAAEAGPGGDWRGNLDTLELDCKLRRLDAVIMADSWTAAGPLVERLSAFAQDFYAMPDPVEGPGQARATRLMGEPLVLLWERPLKDWQGLRKTAFDRVAAALILLLVAPLLAVVAVLIKIESPGPVFFRQFRVGFNNQLFSILKFRSMRNDAADRLASQQTIRGDVRVTRVGAVLRRTSVDELPQLINVLLGEMSLVGPRPHAPGTSAEGKPIHALVVHYGRRHLVRPGITGLAQVRGFRGGMHTTQHVLDRLQADLEYIRRQSLRLDVRIIMMTVIREMRSKNAF